MTGWLKRIRGWTVDLPSSWGLGQAEIHSSLLITLGIASLFFFSLGFFRVGLAELRTLSVTLPIVWIASLAVRLAAQQLAVGKFTEYAETVIGPTGNLRTDYEYFPSRVSFAYSITGQLVSLGLISLGMIIVASISPSSSSALTWGQLCDLRGGWDSHAWASQIMWLNAFLFVLHLLPTVPFDFRATVFSILGSRTSCARDPRVFRRVASFDSHLSTALFGAGFGAICIQLPFGGGGRFAWYAAIAASVYLFVASQWESAQAEELDDELRPTPLRLNRQERQEERQEPHLTFGQHTSGQPDSLPGNSFEAFDSAEDNSSRQNAADSNSASPADIDEILRKIHRCGNESLTEEERRALITASQEIQASREAKRR